VTEAVVSRAADLASGGLRDQADGPRSQGSGSNVSLMCGVPMELACLRLD
jgi:hypothetical protein